MAITDAIAQINQFKGHSLTETIAAIESKLTNAGVAGISSVNESFHINQQLLVAAAAIKRASSQVDIVIHAVGIVCALPHILESDEVVESLSLGAGSAGSDFDLVTSKRIAEFKFINWQGGSEAVRKKTLFEDYFRLVREQTFKEKYLYLLNTEIPMRFLRGRSNILRLLDRNNRLKEDFVARYGHTYHTVGEFYSAHEEAVRFVNLVEVVPGFDTLVKMEGHQR
jgi:hypothetical protein